MLLLFISCSSSNCRCTLDLLCLQLIDELLPVVAGAPNLGGHNRSGESIKATKAKKKMQQLGSSAAPLALRAGPASGNVAQVPNASTLHSSIAVSHESAWGQAPLLVRVGTLSVTSSSKNPMVFCRMFRSS